MGRDKNSSIVYVIDFGLAKRYRDATTHQHIPFGEGRGLTGTPRYVSIVWPFLFSHKLLPIPIILHHLRSICTLFPNLSYFHLSLSILILILLLLIIIINCNPELSSWLPTVAQRRSGVAGLHPHLLPPWCAPLAGPPHPRPEGASSGDLQTEGRDLSRHSLRRPPF